MKRNILLLALALLGLSAATISVAALPKAADSRLQRYRCQGSRLVMVRYIGQGVRLALPNQELELVWQSPQVASNATFEWRVQNGVAQLSRRSSKLPVISQCRLESVATR